MAPKKGAAGETGRRYLKFGDTLSLKALDQNGYISGGGIVDARLFLEQLKDGVDVPPNLRDCRFMAMNKFQYSAAKALGRRRKGDDDDDEKSTTSTGALGLLKEAFQTETSLNSSEFNRLNGDCILYGAVVQFKHCASGKFLTLQKFRAEHEPSSMRVVLLENGDEGSWWRICPGYRTHNEGDKVVFGEIAMFESVKFKLQYLNLSSTPMDIPDTHPYVQHVLEVNGVNTEAPVRFKFVPLSDSDKIAPQHETKLRGEDVVAFYHVNKEAYLVYDGGKVFFQYAAKNSAGQRKLNSNGLWKIECRSAYWAADPVEIVTSEYKIKHLASGNYLAASEPDGIRLTEFFADDDAQWRFHPIGATAAGETTLSRGQLVNLQSCFLNTYLGDALRCEDSGLGVDDVMAELSPAKRVKDALAPTRATNEDLHRLVVVRNSMKQCRRYITALSALPPFPAVAEELSESEKDTYCRSVAQSGLRGVILGVGTLVIDVLTRLLRLVTHSSNLNPLTRDGEPDVKYQTVFREQQAASVMIEMVDLLLREKGLPLWFFDRPALFQGKLLYINQLCYRFLMQFCKGNLENKTVLTRFIPVMQSHLGPEMKAANTMMEVYRGNIDELRRVTDEQIQRFVTLLSQQKRPRFLAFLSALCCCGQDPLPENQNRIVEIMFESNPHLLLDVQINALSDKLSVILKESDKPMTFDCADFFGKADALLMKDTSDCTPNELLFLYYLKTLELFRDLCMGRNRAATDFLIQNSDRLGVGYRNLLQITSAPKLPFILRSAACELLQCLYVDREPNEPIPSIRYTRIWSNIVKEVQPKQRVLVNPYAHFPDKAPTPGYADLKAYCTSFFDAMHGKFDLDKPGQNRLTRSLLAHTSMLAKFGFFHVESDDSPDPVPNFSELRVLLDCLLDILDGRDDVASSNKFNLSARFSDDECGLVVMKAKIEICDIMDLCFDFRVERRIALFLEMYDRVFQSAFGGQDVVLMTRYLMDLNQFKSNPIWTEHDLITARTQMFSTPIIGVKVAAGTASLPTIPLIVQCLLDLLRYPYQPLVAKAFALLNRHMGQRSVFITTMNDVQILVFPDIASVFYESRSNVSEVRRQTKWLGSKNEAARHDAYVSVAAILDIFIQMCTVGGEVFVNGRLIPTDTTNRLKYQTVLRNLRASEYVFAILKLPLVRIKRAGSLDGVEDIQRRDLFQKCYTFLQAFVNDNEQNQRLAFANRPIYASHLGVEGLNVADAFGACVENNAHILAQIDDRLLLSWFELIRIYGRQARWLRVFMKFLRVGAVFLKRNQIKVLKGLVEYRTSVTSLCLTSQERSQRVQWMEEEEQKTKQMGSALRYHTTCVDLIAKCCEGKNPDGQAIARTLISFETLIDHILSLEWRVTESERGEITYEKGDCVARDTVRFVRRPLLDLLHFAFVASPDPKARELVAEERNRIWSVDEELDNPQGNTNTLMKEIFTELLKFANALQTNSDPEELSEHEDYVCDCVFPLLTSYYNYIYQPRVFATDLASPEQHQITRGIRVLVTNIYNKLKLAHRIKAAHLLTAMTACDSDEPLWTEIPTEEHVSRKSTISAMGPLDLKRELYKEGLKACIMTMAPLCGVLDTKRMIGVGLRSMAEILMQNENPETGEDVIPQSLPPCSYREVVWRVYDAMSSDERNDHWPPEVALAVLRISRAMVYLEDPYYATRTSEQRDNDWSRFLENQPVNKSEPRIACLKWVQNKYDRLGLSVLAVKWVAHTDVAVRLAALRLLATMLEEGNNTVQDTLFAYFKTTKDESFFFTCRSILRRFLDDFKEYRSYLKARARQLAHVPTEDEDPATPALFDIGAVMEVVKLIRHLCEGHHSNMQCFVRYQEGNLNSYDLLQDCVYLIDSLREFLEESLAVCDPTLFQICIEACLSLSESIQGPCTANQDALVNTNMVVVADKIFSTVAYCPNTEVQVRTACPANTYRSKLKIALLNFLLNLLEGIRSPQLPSQIIAMLSFPSLRRQMVLLFRLLNGPRTPLEESIWDAFPVNTRHEMMREEAFSYYFVIKYVQPFDEEDLKNPCASLQVNCKRVRRCNTFCIEHLLEDNYPIDSFFRSKATCVEILRDRRVERIYYRTPENCLRLKSNPKWVSMTQNSMFDVDRDNAQEKVEGFIAVITNLSFEIEHKTMLSNHRLLKYTMQWRAQIEDIPMFLSVLICTLIYFFYDRFDRPWFENPGLEAVVYVLRILHLIAAVVFCASWFVTEGKILSHARQERLAAAAASKRRLKALHAASADEVTQSSSKETLKPYQIKLDDRPEQTIEPPSSFVKDMMMNMLPYYYMLYFAISLLGVIILDFPFLYAFHMLDYFRRPDGGLIVVQALAVGGPKLLKTGVMGVIIIFLWGCISFTAFHDDLMEVDAQCYTMFQCMSLHLLAGFRGDFDFYDTKIQVIPEQFNRNGKDQGRTLFLIVFFIVWQFLLLNIIIGQIIETFEEIRDEKREREEDSEEHCFICSISRIEFDQHAAGFEHHVENDHSPWAYLFYLQYLNTKDPIDYNGVESYVSSMLADDNVQWMPIQRASVLDNSAHNASTTTLDELKTSITALAENVSTIGAAVERLERAQQSSQE